ncbi:MAG TPA: hypothetical protein VLA95_05560, partial [Gemmatimonadales bacterium]|nr:hypothetical protein [Gemmatimonadales bacterium]
PVAVGGRLDLSVTVGPDVYTATGSVPVPPVITAVGGTFTRADPIRVEWTAATNPDRFTVSAFECWKSNPYTYTDTEVAGNRRSYAFPGELPRDEYFLTVTSYGDGAFTGPVHPGSRMNIRGGRDFGVVGYC